MSQDNLSSINSNSDLSNREKQTNNNSTLKKNNSGSESKDQFENLYKNFEQTHSKICAHIPELIDVSQQIQVLDNKKLLELLKKLPRNRTNEDISILYQKFKNLEFIKNIAEQLGINTMLRCIQHFQYQKTDSKKFVFREREKGDKFYIIISGSVRVVTDVYIGDLKMEKELAQLQSGKSFGELALIGNDGRRSASIQAIEDCKFATLNKQCYQYFLLEKYKSLIEKKTEIMSQCDLFKSLIKHRLFQSMSFYFSTKQFKNNEVVYKENSSPQFIYIISKGSFKILKNIDIPQEDQPIQDNLLNPHKQYIENKRKKQAKQPQIEVTQIGQGAAFGHEEILLKQKKRNTTVVCSSLDSEVLKVKAHDYLTHILTQYSNKEIKNIKNRILNTQQIRIEKFNNQLSTQKNYKEYLFRQNVDSLDTQSSSSKQLQQIQKSPLKIQSLQQNSSYNTQSIPHIYQQKQLQQPIYIQEENESTTICNNNYNDEQSTVLFENSHTLQQNSLNIKSFKNHHIRSFASQQVSPIHNKNSSQNINQSFDCLQSNSIEYHNSVNNINSSSQNQSPQRKVPIIQRNNKKQINLPRLNQNHQNNNIEEQKDDEDGDENQEFVFKKLSPKSHKQKNNHTQQSFDQFIHKQYKSDPRYQDRKKGISKFNAQNNNQDNNENNISLKLTDPSMILYSKQHIRQKLFKGKEDQKNFEAKLGLENQDHRTQKMLVAYIKQNHTNQTMVKQLEKDSKQKQNGGGNNFYKLQKEKSSINTQKKLSSQSANITPRPRKDSWDMLEEYQQSQQQLSQQQQNSDQILQKDNSQAATNQKKLDNIGIENFIVNYLFNKEKMQQQEMINFISTDRKKQNYEKDPNSFIPSKKINHQLQKNKEKKRQFSIQREQEKLQLINFKERSKQGILKQQQQLRELNQQKQKYRSLSYNSTFESLSSTYGNGKMLPQIYTHHHYNGNINNNHYTNISINNHDL